VNASPREDDQPMRSPLSRSSSAITPALRARSAMLDVARQHAVRRVESHHQIDARALTSSVRSPHCGPAAASSRKKSPRPIAELRGRPAPPRRLQHATEARRGHQGASRRCRRPMRGRRDRAAPAERSDPEEQRSEDPHMLPEQGGLGSPSCYGDPLACGVPRSHTPIGPKSAAGRRTARTTRRTACSHPHRRSCSSPGCRGPPAGRAPRDSLSVAAENVPPVTPAICCSSSGLTVDLHRLVRRAANRSVAVG